MTSSREQLRFILDQLSGLDGITSRPMMGEFILYYHGRIVGGIYDDRLLIKPVRSAVNYVEDPVFEQPYEGAKEMLLIENIDDRDYLTGLIQAIYKDLPEPKKKA